MKVLKFTLLSALVCSVFALYTPLNAQGEFGALGNGEVVIIYDGQGLGQSFKVRRPSKNNLKRYPVVGLGNSPVLQESASASKQPKTAPDGYYVIFSIGDDIGGKQAIYQANGVPYEGIWRVVKPISAADFNESGEIIIPEGVMYKERLVADYLIVARANSFAEPVN